MKHSLVLILISITLFTLALVIGILDYNDNIISTNSSFILEYKFKKPDMFLLIKNNLALISLFLSGAFLFGITTFVNLIYNGFFIGFIVNKALQKRTTLNEILILTLPHGIFEIPAIIIAGAAGFKIPYEIVRYLAGKKEQILTKEDIKEYLTLALISIILIVIAAFIEAYVTPKVAEYFLKPR